jgi:hypothetical protein
MKQVCRNLLIFAFLTGLSPIVTRASQSPVASGAAAARHSAIGTGLDNLVYWTTSLPFLDVFKTSSLWMSGTADVWDDHRVLDIDEHGWVRSCPRQSLVPDVPFGRR